MSTTVDSRVVEMRFDNKQFEANVQTSMSTLQKLKQSLNLTGASKGLEQINIASKNNNIGALGAAAETVGLKFNAMWSIADQTIRNITNSVEHSAKRMVSALTIDPIKTGLSEYETKINAIQVIKANTRGKNDMNDITSALDELNTYADKTIYNFAQMTSNIGKFTAQGLDVQQAANAVQGLANLAAASGANAEDMSRATYQMSQALSGTIKLMDWNSLRNSNMATVELKNTLIDLAKVHDIAIDDMIEKEGSFEQTLSSGWLTGEMFTEAMNIYSGVYSEAELAAMGFTESQIANFQDLAAMAESAATEVKTFTQLWDVLKETAQSGWTQTWELLIGDFDTAKNMWTNLQNYFSGIINGWSDTRNNILEGALGNPFQGIIDKISKVTGAVDKVKDATEAVTKATKDYEEIVNKVIGGEYGNGQSRWDKLSEEGYDWAKVQNMVNEKMGDSTRYTEKMDESQKKLEKTQKITISDLAKMSDAQLKQIGFTKKEIDAFKELKEQSEKTGISIEEIIENPDLLSGHSLMTNSLKNAWGAVVDVFNTVKTAWQDIFPPKSIEERSDGIYNMLAAVHNFTSSLRGLYDENGKLTETGDKLVRTFKGVFAVFDIITTILGGGVKIAFKVLTTILGAFDMNILDLTSKIGDLIVKFRDWLFSGNLVSQTIQKLIAKLPDAINKIKEWFKAFKETPMVQKIIGVFEKLIGYFSKLKNIDLSSIDFASVLSGIKTTLSPLIDDMVEFGKNIVEGLQNGIGAKLSDVADKVREMANTVITTFCDLLGIHSPSTVAFAWGGFIIEGFVNGIAAALHWVTDGIQSLSTIIGDWLKGDEKTGSSLSAYEWGLLLVKKIGNGIKTGLTFIIDSVKTLGSKIASAFEDINFSEIWNKFKETFGGLADFLIKLIPLIPISAILILIKKFTDITSGISDAVGNFNDILEGMKKLPKKVGKIMDGFKNNLNANAIKKMAEAIAIIVGSIVVLTLVNQDRMFDAVAVIVVLTAVLAALVWAMNKMGDTSVSFKDGFNAEGLKLGLVAIGGALVLISMAVKNIGKLRPGQAIQGFIGLAGMIAAILIVLVAYNKLAKAGGTGDMDKAGIMLLKMSASLLILSIAAKQIGKLKAGDMVKGAIFMAGFVVFVKALVAVTKSSGKDIDKIGGMVLKISIAMMLLVGVCKLAGTLNAGDIIPAVLFAGGFIIFLKALVAITKVGKDDSIAKLGGLLMSVSLSLILMIGMCKLAGTLSLGEIIKGAAFVAGFMVMLKFLVKILTIGNEQQMAKVAGTILAMSFAIAVLAGVSILMSMMSIEGLLKGVGAVAVLGAVMMGMIWATKGAEKCVGNLIVMVVAIGIMATAVGVLSTIDGTRLTGATIALTTVMGMFALLAVATGTMTKAMGPLIIMTIAVGLLGGIIYVLAKLPIESVLASAASLSILLLALSASCLILSGVGSAGPAAFLGIVVLLALIAGVGALIVGIGYLVEKFPQLETFLNKGIPILEKIGYALGSFFGNIIGGFSAGVTSGLPEIGENISAFAENISKGVNSLGEESVSGMVNLVKIMGLLGASNIIDSISTIITGTSSMDTFATQLDAFADAIISFSGKVAGKIDEESVNAAANAGLMLAEMQSTITGTGGVIQWFCGEKDMGAFGTQLVAFGNAIVLFSSTVAGKVNEEAVATAARAGTLMTTLQKDLVRTGGVVQWFCGEKDFAAFGTQLVAFGSAIVIFSETVAGKVNEEAVATAARAGTLMATLQKDVVRTGGVVQWFCGEKDFSTFGSQLLAFGSAITLFSETVSVGINEEAVATAARAGTLMATLQQELVGTGGIVQWFCGEKDFSTFGSQLVAFGSAIKTFSEEIGGGINEEAVASASNAGLMMAELQNAIPTDKWFDGKVSLDDFGTKIKSFGKSLVDYGTTVSELDTSKISTSITQANRLATFAQTVADLDTTNLWKFGDVSLIGTAMKTYSKSVEELDTMTVSGSISSANKLKELINSLTDLDTSGVDKFKVGSIGTTMKTYAKDVGDIDTGVVSRSITSANRLKNFINSLSDLDSSGIGNFKIGSIGTAIKNYSVSVADVDSGAISSSISGAKKIKDFINSLSNLDTSGVGSFKSAVSTLGQTNIDGVVDAFKGSASKMSGAGTNMMSSLAQGMKSGTSSLTTAASSSVNSIFNSITSKSSQFQEAGKTLFANLCTGIASMKGAVANASSSTASTGVTSIRNYWSSFYSAGSYLVSGFCQGINANTYRARAQATAMANAAERAAREALRINSPSKVFVAIGSGVVEGFVKGVSDNMRYTTDAVHEMSDTAINGFGDTMSAINRVLNSDMDFQPTIRPVVDLSEVAYGVGAINEMMSMGSTIGVRSNVGAISASMNRNRQNGVNGEIVSAIDKLRKDIGNMERSSYNINGITYDDGSNVSDAVKSLVRAVRVEGRI